MSRIIAEYTEYTLVVPSELVGKISFFRSNHKKIDYLQFLKSSLLINGYDYEIKNKVIYVKKDKETQLFNDEYGAVYTIPIDLDLSEKLENIKNFRLGNILFVRASSQFHADLKAFLKVFDSKRFSVRSYALNNLDVRLLDSYKKVFEKISFNPVANKVAIYTTLERHFFYQDLIQKLDNHPKMFNVHFVISSVNKSSLFDRGFGFLFSQGGVSIDTLNSVVNYASVGFERVFNAFFNLVESNQENYIFAKPFIQLKSGQSATFRTGKEVPFLTSQVDSSTGQVIRNVERLNIGLSVTSRIDFDSQGRLILSIKQSMSSISETQLNTAQDVITDNQYLETVINIKTGSVYAVGGLKDQRRSNRESYWGLSSSDSVTDNEIVIFVAVSAVDVEMDYTLPAWWD